MINGPTDVWACRLIYVLTRRNYFCSAPGGCLPPQYWSHGPVLPRTSRLSPETWPWCGSVWTSGGLWSVCWIRWPAAGGSNVVLTSHISQSDTTLQSSDHSNFCYDAGNLSSIHMYNLWHRLRHSHPFLNDNL